MTNPDNAIGTNGAYGGRTSVNAFNDVLSVFYSRGRLSGWNVAPSSGMTLACGGGVPRDVAVARDNSNNLTTINNISGSPIPVDVSAAPASGQRYDAVVLYVDNPPQGESTVIDNPGACGILCVAGTTSAPTEADIRSAITADGASGSTAYYVQIATIRVPAGTTTITQNLITPGFYVSLKEHIVGQRIDGTVTYQTNWADYGTQSGTQNNTKVWRDGDTVTVRAIVKPTANITGGTTAIPVATINEDYMRPPFDVGAIGQGSGINRFFMKITTAGVISVERYGAGSTIDIPSGAYLAATLTYASNAGTRYI